MVPAHTGVVPSDTKLGAPGVCGPRAHGGGPRAECAIFNPGKWSPRTRGWSRVEPRCLRLVIVVPAHAGVVPGRRRSAPIPGCGPRPRGGGPRPPEKCPHPRLWSPRTRGWSPSGRDPRRSWWVVPAHAGVVPDPGPRDGDTRRGPRARGGGPWARMRPPFSFGWSPRTREWSPRRSAVRRRGGVVPAQAQVVLRCTCRRGRRACCPCAGGGDPQKNLRVLVTLKVVPAHAGVPPDAVPHPRPCSVVPAHAGVVRIDCPGRPGRNDQECDPPDSRTSP